jgi:hypothetical protein
VTFLVTYFKKAVSRTALPDTDAEVKAAEAILKMSKDGFNHVFDEWQQCWDKCIESTGTHV